MGGGHQNKKTERQREKKQLKYENILKSENKRLGRGEKQCGREQESCGMNMIKIYLYTYGSGVMETIIIYS